MGKSSIDRRDSSLAEVLLAGAARATKTVVEQITRFDRFIIEIDCLSMVSPELSFEQLTYCSTLAWMSAANKIDWSCQAATRPPRSDGNERRGVIGQQVLRPSL